MALLCAIQRRCIDSMHRFSVHLKRWRFEERHQRQRSDNQNLFEHGCVRINTIGVHNNIDDVYRVYLLDGDALRQGGGLSDECARGRHSVLLCPVYAHTYYTINMQVGVTILCTFVPFCVQMEWCLLTVLRMLQLPFCL
jgi:hypothetical protein